MASEWRQTTWGEEISLEYGKALRGYSSEGGSVRVYGANGPIGWTSKPLAPGPGVILGRKGAYRGVHYSPDPFFVIDTAYYLSPKSALDMRWLYYAIIHAKLGDIDDGSPIPSTTRAAVYFQDMTVPPLSEQKGIAHILGSFDDKIECNRRMNRTLEAMARAIFQSWFVDFDPVRAKVDGRAPAGMDAATVALFSEHFEDSELGKIPKGWQQASFDAVADNPRRGCDPSEVEPSTPYIGLEHMPRRCIALGEWGRVEDVASNKFRFSTGEILFGKLRPYFHKVVIAPVDGVCSTDILVIVPKSPAWFGFALGHVSSYEMIQFVDAASTGTKMPRTNWPDLARFPVALPPVAIAEAHNRIVEPMLDRIRSNIHESRTLAALRDTLLPKLISGELRVPEGERIVGRAT